MKGEFEKKMEVGSEPNAKFSNLEVESEESLESEESEESDSRPELDISDINDYFEPS